MGHIYDLNLEILFSLFHISSAPPGLPLDLVLFLYITYTFLSVSLQRIATIL
jgi:hypothetical protein